jgi:serine/threonine protein kinase/Flp pilus assembly protein TadD
MELADRSLWDRFAEARGQGLAGIPMGELLGVLGEVAKVVDFLNEPVHRLERRSGVAIHHRDIKPQNIMLIGRGVKVADFGLSSPDDPAATPRSLSGLTFAYAAPEAFRHRVAAASDQYSLAVTFCQLRGGRLPFGGPPASVMMGHLFGDPDLCALPPPERTVVARAMAKHSAERWPDCRSLIEALAGCVAAGAPDALPAGPKGRGEADLASCSVVVPPFSGRWDESNFASSDATAATGDDAQLSRYCLALPTPDGPDASIGVAAPTSPTVLVAGAAGRPARRRWPRLMVAVTLVVATALAAWTWSARPASRADVPALATMAEPKASRPPALPPAPRPSGVAERPPAPRAAPAVTLAAIRLPDVSAWRSLIRKASTTARSWLALLRAVGRPSPTPPTPTAPRPVASTWPGPPGRPDAMRVGMPEVLEIEAGRSLSIPLRLNRAGITRPLAVHFEELPAGVRIPDVTIPPGQDRAEVTVQARLDAPATTRPVVMALEAGSAGATARFQLRVRANPALLHRTMGHTLLACGRPAEAVAAFTRAIEAGVSDAHVHNNRGLAYSSLNRLDAAISDFTEACRLRPTDAAFRRNRGIAYARRGDDFRALLDFDTAIRLRPDYIRAYEDRAKIYLKQGDKARACADSTRAAELARAARPEGRAPAPLPPPSRR